MEAKIIITETTDGDTGKPRFYFELMFKHPLIDRNLDNNMLEQENWALSYKVALRQAVRVCDDFGIQYKVVK